MKNNDFFPLIILSELDDLEENEGHEKMNTEPGNNALGIILLLIFIVFVSLCCNSGFLLGF